MICPKGEPVHENLSSEYTDVPQLLSTLRAEEFSGMVEVRSPGKKGVFFVSLGETIDATAGPDSDPASLVGEEAIEELLVVCTRPDATLGVYRLSSQEVEFAVSTLQSEMVFKGLSTDFVRLDRFLKKLADERHHGFIEVLTKDNQTAGVIALREGRPDLLVTMTEAGTPSFSGAEKVPEFLEDISKRSALFNVHRTVSTIVHRETLVAETARPVLAAETERIAAAGHSVREEKSDTNVGETVEMAVDKTNGRQHVPEEASGVAREGTPEGRKGLLLDLQGVFFKVERFVNGLAEPGSFQRAFKRACVEKSDDYSFLDPFEGLFDYSEGQLHVDDQVPTEAFAVGVAQCLNLTLTYLQRELPKKTVLPVGLKGDIESSFRGHRQVLGESGDSGVIPASFQVMRVFPIKLREQKCSL